MSTPGLIDERRLARLPLPGTFGPEDLVGLPEPVQRYLTRAITPGTRLARSARLAMRGRIRVGRWLPFHARQVLDPHRGFVWTARAAGVISGSDRLVEGAGRMDWRLLGLVPVVRAEGDDVTRSAAGRAGAEGIWLPTALLPRFGVTWTADAPDRVTATHEVAGTPVRVTCHLHGDGRPRAVVLDRWGDPDGTGAWGWHPFGGEFTAHRSFGGLHVPAAGRLGWFYGTDRWPEGEFFRFELTHLEPVTD